MRLRLFLVYSTFLKIQCSYVIKNVQLLQQYKCSMGLYAVQLVDIEEISYVPLEAVFHKPGEL